MVGAAGGFVVRLPALLVLLLLCSCTSQTDTDLALYSQGIKVGVSDKKAVSAILGPPPNSFSRGPDEVWTYVGTSDSKVAAALGNIPYVRDALVSPFVSSESFHVAITFHKDIVSACKIVIKRRDAPPSETRDQPCDSE